MFTATGFSQQDIVKDGLVLWLDANDKTSYPGTGTVWRDLSRGSNNGTLTNGPTFTGSNGGTIICDGTNDYILANQNSLNPYFSSTSVSHFIWVYPTSAGQIVVELGQTAINASWHDSNIEINSAGAFSFSTWHGGLGNRVVSSNLSFNNWYNVGFSYDGTTLTAYINGSSIGTTNFSRAAPYNNGFQYHYALFAIDSTNMGTSGYGGGRVGTFVVYNRAITSTEVLQNYNATKPRFGF
jgi:hypothetical protein